MFYVYEIRSKFIKHKAHSRNVAIHVLETYNSKREELWCVMMDKETYERNYGYGQSYSSLRDNTYSGASNSFGLYDHDRSI